MDNHPKKIMQARNNRFVIAANLLLSTYHSYEQEQTLTKVCNKSSCGGLVSLIVGITLFSTGIKGLTDVRVQGVVVLQTQHKVRVRNVGAAKRDQVACLIRHFFSKLGVGCIAAS